MIMLHLPYDDTVILLPVQLVFSGCEMHWAVAGCWQSKQDISTIGSIVP